MRRGEVANPCPPEIGLRMARLWDAIQESAANRRSNGATDVIIYSSPKKFCPYSDLGAYHIFGTTLVGQLTALDQSPESGTYPLLLKILTTLIDSTILSTIVIMLFFLTAFLRLL